MEKDYLQIILEDMNSKFDFVIESYNTLDRKIDSVRDELKEDIELLGFKIDAVATDLKAHRADTEAHDGIYRVKEG